MCTAAPVHHDAGRLRASQQGDIVVKGQLHLTHGTYNINSLTMNAGGNLYIDSGPVILNVAGYSTPGNASGGYMTTPVDFTGQSVNHRMMDSFTWRKF